MQRFYRRRPGIASVIVLTIGLGVGVNTAVFSLVDALLVRELPYPSPEAILSARPVTARGPLGATFSGAAFITWRTETRAFAALAGYSRYDAVMSRTRDSARIAVARVSPALFDALGVPASMGRPLHAADAPPLAPEAVISHALWLQQFGGRTEVIGQLLPIDETAYTVVGVMPSGFSFPGGGVEAWIALDPRAIPQRQADGTVKVSVPQVRVLGRLRDGVTLAQARAEALGVTADGSPGVSLVCLQEELTAGVRPALLMLQGTVALVLLLACANVTNILLAVGATRQREFAVRLALGARPGQLIAQLARESVALAGAGGLVGLVLAWWTLHLLRASGEHAVMSYADVGLNGRVLVFALAVSLLAGVLAGLCSAWPSIRRQRLDALGGGARGLLVTDRRGGQTGRLLVSAQLCVALVLVVGAGALAQSVVALLSGDGGYRGDAVVTLDVGLPPIKYPTVDRRRVALQTILERLTHVDGASHASLTTRLPVSADGGYFDVSPRDTHPPDFSLDDRAQVTARVFVSREYFRALQIRVRQGGAFQGMTTPPATPVVVISATVAKRDFAGRDPIGQTVNWRRRRWTVVGVVDDVQEGAFRTASLPIAYHLFDQLGYREEMWTRELLKVSIALKTATGLEPRVLADARRLIRAVEPDAIVDGPITVRDRLYRAAGPINFYTALLGAFAALALVLAAGGVSGLLTFAVHQRSREIGVRLALGASRGHVVALVVRDGLRLAVWGALVGVPGAIALCHALTSVIQGAQTPDGLVVAAAGGVLLAVAGLATLAPARRAVRIDPIVILRRE